MSEISEAFKQDVVAQIESLPQSFKVSGVEVGDDDIVAVAKIGIRTMGTTPLLQVRRVDEMLKVEVRHLATLGPKNSLTNLTVNGLACDMVQKIIGKKELSRQDRICHVLMVDAFTSRKRNVWDLMAMITLEMNNWPLPTRSVVAFLDGEVYVDAALDCDFETLPEALEDRLQIVASQAKILAIILRSVRRELSEAPASADECFRETSEIKKMLKNDSKRDSEAAAESQEEDLEDAAANAITEEDDELAI